jgi:hypothetical protein
MKILDYFKLRKPPNDQELFSNLDAASINFLAVLNEYCVEVHKEQDPESLKISKSDFEKYFKLITDASMGSGKHPRMQELKLQMTKLIPKEFEFVLSNLTDDKYLPPALPPRFCAWIQNLLNETLPFDKQLTDESLNQLHYLIGTALVQGNPPRALEDLTRFERNLISILYSGTLRGLEHASRISDIRDRANYHSAHIFMLVMILGVRCTEVNNLKTAEDQD